MTCRLLPATVALKPDTEGQGIGRCFADEGFPPEWLVSMPMWAKRLTQPEPEPYGIGAHRLERARRTRHCWPMRRCSPYFVPPCIPTFTAKLPTGSDCVHEPKFHFRSSESSQRANP